METSHAGIFYYWLILLADAVKDSLSPPAMVV